MPPDEIRRFDGNRMGQVHVNADSVTLHPDRENFSKIWNYRTLKIMKGYIIFLIFLYSCFVCRHTHHPYFCIVRNSNTGLSQESLPFHLTLRGTQTFLLAP
jgi:hypothetical protein